MTLGKSLNLSGPWLPRNDRVGLHLPKDFIPDHVLGTNDTLMNSSKGQGVKKCSWASQWMQLHGKVESS